MGGMDWIGLDRFVSFRAFGLVGWYYDYGYDYEGGWCLVCVCVDVDSEPAEECKSLHPLRIPLRKAEEQERKERGRDRKTSERSSSSSSKDD